MGRIDLHLHSTFSDGSLSPTDVIRLGHTAGLTALAVTDHDTIDGLSEALAAGASLGIEVIPGIEISARFEGREAHILGYFIDWNDATLLERLEQQRASRHYRNPLVVEKLNQLGLDLTYEEVIATAGSPNRASISLGLVIHETFSPENVRWPCITRITCPFHASSSTCGRDR